MRLNVVEEVHRKVSVKTGEDHQESGYVLIAPFNASYTIEFFKNLNKNYPASIPSSFCNLKNGDQNRTIDITSTGCTIVS